jgi:hypothetical protein
MRHALGLDRLEQPHAPPLEQQTLQSSAPERLTLHRPPRRFVKDGEVPVTVVRRTPSDGAPALGPAAVNQLEAARQTIRSQAIAAERAERALVEAQANIRDLRTKLAHERLARDEALATLSRLEAERDVAVAERDTLRAELAAEHVAREKLDQELQRALEARRLAEAGLRVPKRRGRPPKQPVAVAHLEDELPAPAPRKRGRPRKIVAEGTTTLVEPKRRGRPPKARAELALGSALAPPRRGRPPKEPKPVRWWAKGWKPGAD